MLARAKRLGWDHTMDLGRYEDFDDFDREDDVEVFGELEVFMVHGPVVPSYRQYLVDGQVVDPGTVQEISTRELREILGIEEGEPNG